MEKVTLSRELSGSFGSVQPRNNSLVVTERQMIAIGSANIAFREFMLRRETKNGEANGAASPNNSDKSG
jgi:hypothetical protein